MLTLSFESYHLQTPLHLAARNGNLEIVSVLMDAGADINVKNVRLKMNMKKNEGRY